MSRMSQLRSPFRRRSSLPSLLIVLGAIAAATIGFAATMILRHIPTGQIEVIDGDTVRFNGVAYRRVGNHLVFGVSLRLALLF
jgi:hypothetical protein